MVHLICLHCNRANTSEAKFCTDCGASLLRKFCKSCHAANDSSAHFCQSCGTALRSAAETAAAMKSAPPAPRGDFVPSLTDVVTLGPTVSLQPAPSMPLAVGANTQLAPQDDPPWATVSVTTATAVRRASRPVPAIAMLAIGAAIVVPIAVWFWPAADRPAGAALPRSAATIAPMMPAAVHSTTTGSRSGDAAAAAAEMAARLLQADHNPSALADAKSGADLPAANRVPGDTRESARSAVKRSLADPVAAAPRVPPRVTATPEAAAAVRATRAPAATSPSPAAARECTPTMEALALCAAATNSTGR